MNGLQLAKVRDHGADGDNADQVILPWVEAIEVVPWCSKLDHDEIELSVIVDVDSVSVR